MATKKTVAPKKTLVIVESPSKAKTIGKFLGSRYKVIASVGHVRDLPKSKLGIDIENDFEPQYINIRGKGDLIKSLKNTNFTIQQDIYSVQKNVYNSQVINNIGGNIEWQTL